MSKASGITDGQLRVLGCLARNSRRGEAPLTAREIGYECAPTHIECKGDWARPILIALRKKGMVETLGVGEHNARTWVASKGFHAE